MNSRLCAWVGLVVALGLSGCGSRTALDVRELGEAANDATVGDTGRARDAGFDVDTRFDATGDAATDTGHPTEAGLTCDNGAAPTAYLLDQSGILYVFDPATLSVTALGAPSCPSDFTPFTLSVSREGKAYVLYEDWNIFEVDLKTLACTQTPFVPGQLGLSSELGIAISRTTAQETLLVAGVPDGQSEGVLAMGDLTSFSLSEVGPTVPAPAGAFPLDIQADLHGHLFGLSDDGLILEMDVTTGAVLDQGAVPLNPQQSWAVMAYEDAVYAFSAGDVFRYDFGTHAATMLGTDGLTVIGASAVPCSRGQ